MQHFKQFLRKLFKINLFYKIKSKIFEKKDRDKEINKFSICLYIIYLWFYSNLSLLLTGWTSSKSCTLTVIAKTSRGRYSYSNGVTPKRFQFLQRSGKLNTIIDNCIIFDLFLFYKVLIRSAHIVWHICILNLLVCNHSICFIWFIVQKWNTIYLYIKIYRWSWRGWLYNLKKAYK